MEQPQACSISRSIIMAAASIASGTLTTCRCLVPGGKHAPLECQRQRRVRTLSPPLSRTVEQSHGFCLPSPLFTGHPFLRVDRRRSFSISSSINSFISSSCAKRRAAMMLYNLSADSRTDDSSGTTNTALLSFEECPSNSNGSQQNSLHATRHRRSTPTKRII